MFIWASASLGRAQTCEEDFAGLLRKGDTLVEKSCDLVILSKQRYLQYYASEKQVAELRDSLNKTTGMLLLYQAQYNSLRMAVDDSGDAERIVLTESAVIVPTASKPARPSTARRPEITDDAVMQLDTLDRRSDDRSFFSRFLGL